MLKKILACLLWDPVEQESATRAVLCLPGFCPAVYPIACWHKRWDCLSRTSIGALPTGTLDAHL